MQYPVVSPSPTSCTVQRDLSEFLNRLLEMERLATAHEWWMYGRVLPEARQIFELISLLAAARAELFGLLKSTGFPQLADIEHLGASELIFTSPFANDLGWAQTHREESLQVFRLAASSVPVLLVEAARIVNRLDGNVSGTPAHRGEISHHRATDRGTHVRDGLLDRARG